MLKEEYPVGDDGQRLSPLAPPSAEFLAELRERARRFGWSGDYTEIINFLNELYRQAGLEPPNLEAYGWKEVDGASDCG